MKLIPKAVYVHYIQLLKRSNIPAGLIQEYIKWLRYFLDFCEKHVIAHEKSERLQLFLEKLHEKGQSENQCQRAAHAVSLYFEIHSPRKEEGLPNEEASNPSVSAEVSQVQSPEPSRPSQFREAGYQEKSDFPEWDAVLEAMAAEIKVRHYSRKTLKTYVNWSRQFQRFLKNKPPCELTTADVKEYLTYLAVKCRVAASTQNQAINSLLFFYRHGLKREFGELRDVPRAKKSLYIPVVLSRPEIDAMLAHLSHPLDLVVKLLFGCGLRQFEYLQLRLTDYNLDAGILTIHGKGKKDRTVPLPKSLLPELRDQITRVAELHDRDLAAGYDGVFLDDAVEKKYPKAPREFVHQWFFPQRNLTLVEEAGQRRRWHLHESELQEALYPAVRRAKIPKRVTCHTFRHYTESRIMPSRCMTSPFFFSKLFTTPIGHSA